MIIFSYGLNTRLFMGLNLTLVGFWSKKLPSFLEVTKCKKNHDMIRFNPRKTLIGNMVSISNI